MDTIRHSVIQQQKQTVLSRATHSSGPSSLTQPVDVEIRNNNPRGRPSVRHFSSLVTNKRQTLSSYKALKVLPALCCAKLPAAKRGLRTQVAVKVERIRGNIFLRILFISSDAGAVAERLGAQFPAPKFPLLDMSEWCNILKSRNGSVSQSDGATVEKRDTCRTRARRRK